MSKKAKKLLEGMKNSPNSATPEDLERLYTAYGFEIRHGSNHDIATHPEFPHLQGTIGRHRKLSSAYVRSAIRLIEALEQLKREQQMTEETAKEQEHDDEKSDN